MKFAPILVESSRGMVFRAMEKSGCCEIVLATVNSRDGERLKGTLKQRARRAGRCGFKPRRRIRRFA